MTCRDIEAEPDIQDIDNKIQDEIKACTIKLKYKPKMWWTGELSDEYKKLCENFKKCKRVPSPENF